MIEITVQTKSKNYPVYIGEGILKEIKADFSAVLSSYSKIFVITDENVAKLYKQELAAVLRSLKSVIYYITMSGEKAKTLVVYENIITKAIESGLDRKSAVIAFGGGVIGDLAGFVAATYMRGLPFYQIPTTVLAHDSAVGGKVAINHPLAKNMIGHFYQPEWVIFDTYFLRSLSPREMRSGFAEMIKHALISDHSLLKQLMTTFRCEGDFYRKDLSRFLEAGMRIKVNIVTEDEKEQGVRAYLNFGHTLGHALETYGKYKKWTHGEAIIHGMIYALSLSQNICQLDFDINAFQNWLRALGYQIELPEEISFSHLLELMHSDKKTIFNKINFVLLTKIGKPTLTAIMDEKLKEVYQKGLNK